MKTTISLIALIALMAAGTAYARGGMGGGGGGGMQQSYSGTAHTRGYVSKTGFVKERTNEEDHMDGKMPPKDDDVDAPPPSDDAQDDVDSKGDKGGKK